MMRHNGARESPKENKDKDLYNRELYEKDSLNTANNNGLLNNKRNRSSNNKIQIGNYTKNDESKLLKYALKISELEYKNSQKQTGSIKINSYKDLEPAQIENASEIDFLEFAKYIDSLWDPQDDTGIIKIIPPHNFVENMKKSYHNTVSAALLKDPNKKIPYRVQKINELYKAEVRFFYIVYLKRNLSI